MHRLQPKHIKLKPEEVQDLIKDLNISVNQLPKIRIDDPCVPEECVRGDVLVMEREFEGKLREYFRVVV